MKFTIELSETEVNDLKLVNSHRRNDETIERTLIEMMNQGVRSMIYRYERNKRKWNEMKQLKEQLESLQRENDSLKKK